MSRVECIIYLWVDSRSSVNSELILGWESRTKRQIQVSGAYWPPKPHMCTNKVVRETMMREGRLVRNWPLHSELYDQVSQRRPTRSQSLSSRLAPPIGASSLTSLGLLLIQNDRCSWRSRALISRIIVLTLLTARCSMEVPGKGDQGRYVTYIEH